MAESIVYKGSPLGDYLEGTPMSGWFLSIGTGTYEGDWGLSSDQENFEDEESDSGRDQIQRDFAPPSRPLRRFNSREVQPLITLKEHISRSAKFYNLFTVFLFGVFSNQ